VVSLDYPALLKCFELRAVAFSCIRVKTQVSSLKTQVSRLKFLLYVNSSHFMIRLSMMVSQTLSIAQPTLSPNEKAPSITLSQPSNTTTNVLPPPAPNGGTRAWTQVLMGHLILINSWGYLSSFGLFQAHYTTNLSATPSAISWIGSIQIFLVYLIGTFSGRALDLGYYHTTVALGSALQIIGVFATASATEYWQLVLSQGVCKGLGDGLVFCPTVALVATYFSTKRSLAMAVTASGGATGGIIFPLIAQQMLPRVGFAWTVRTMAFVILFNAIVILLIARVRLPPRKTGPIVEWSAFREPSYTLFCIGMFFNLWAVYFAYFYVSVLTIPSPSLETNMLTS
jgi:MFS family permease